MPRFFGFDDGPRGLFVVAKRDPLSAECLGVEEIDQSILSLQADLDKVGAQMKRTLADRDPAAFPQIAIP